MVRGKPHYTKIGAATYEQMAIRQASEFNPKTCKHTFFFLMDAKEDSHTTEGFTVCTLLFCVAVHSSCQGVIERRG
jgi:hypothetical protein